MLSMRLSSVSCPSLSSVSLHFIEKMKLFLYFDKPRLVF
jgi:hypothetical protein